MYETQTKTDLTQQYDGNIALLKAISVSPEIREKLKDIARKNFVNTTEIINHSLAQCLTTGLLPVLFANRESKKNVSAKIDLTNLIAIKHLIKITPFLYSADPGEVLYLGKPEDRPHVIQFGWKIKMTVHSALTGHLTFLAANPQSLESYHE